MSLFLFMNDSMIGIRKKIILASRSLRRRQLLKQIGLEFEVQENRVDERIDPTKAPEENVLSLSHQKALSVSKTIAEGVVIGVDTIVVLEGKILGKPKDDDEAKEMLRMLSGREHYVYTGFTIIEKPGGRSLSDFDVTAVKFRELDEDEITQYVQSGSPLDKAGAYGIQDDMGAVFVERIHGCFYNVVGLPLAKFYVSLKKFLGNSHG